MSNNLKIIPNNYADDATIVASSTAATFSTDNLKLIQKSLVWRSTDLTTQTLTLTWQNAVTVDSVALAFSNLMANSTVQVQLYTNAADGSPVLDDGEKTITFAYSPPAGFTTIGLSSFPFGGGTYYSTFFAATAVKKIIVTLKSVGNPDGYMELSRIICGKSWNPDYGAAFGITVSTEDSSKSVRTDAGDSVIERKPIYKKLEFTLPNMSESDKSGLTSIFRSNGNNAPIYVVLLHGSGTTEDAQSTQIYGTFSNRLNTDFFTFSFYKTKLTVIEI